MTELAADPFRTVDPSDAIANDAVFPFYLAIANSASRSRVSTVVSTRSTTSARAPTGHARSPGACSQGRRSCANATAPGSTSRPEL
jgi:hypothetical protein